MKKTNLKGACLPSLPDDVLTIIWDDVHRDLRRRMDKGMLKECVDEACFRIASKLGSWLSVFSLFYLHHPLDVYTCGVFAIQHCYELEVDFPSDMFECRPASRDVAVLEKIFRRLGEPTICVQQDKAFLSYTSSFNK